MNKNSPLYDDEIDLIAFLEIIWDGKIKILLIILISFFIGFVYNSQIPINYLNSLTIKPSKSTEFLKFDIVQKMLGTNQSNYPNAIYGPSQLNQSNQLNLDKFINELEDYEEFLMVILNTKKIQDHFSKLNTKDQEKELFKIIKLLKIVVPKKNESKYIINFKWHNPEEAKKILQDILNLTSKNIKKRIDLELDQFLELKKKLILAEDRNRLDYLKEKSAIAKELNIADNQVGNVNLSQQNDLSANIAYYLRGYKAIEKEIELTENRDYQNIKLVEEEINSFKAQKVKFADYNLYLMDVESLNNTKLYLIISILLGLIVGIFYVLISNAFQSKKHLKKD